MTNPSAPPPIANRPKLWGFYRERGLTQQQVADARGRSREWVRQICLEFGHPDRVIPSEEDIAWFFDWSGGELTSADWYPPGLSGSQVSAQASEVAS